MNHDSRTLSLTLAAGAPAVLVTVLLLWTGEFRLKLQWTLTFLVTGAWLAFALAARAHVVRPVQLLANLIAALREGDYSMRVHGATPTDDIGLAFTEANALADQFRENQRGAREATVLVERVIEAIEIAVFAVDERGRIRLVNPAGARLLGATPASLVGQPARAHGLEAFLDGPTPRTLAAQLGGKAGRWELRRTPFRLKGEPHRLIVLADVQRALREEELQAWQRVVRVLGREINNSLAPIRSLAVSLGRQVDRAGVAEDTRADLTRGLEVIASRSDALGRFMAAYARLAKLPPPRLEPVAVGPWIDRLVALAVDLPVQVVPGPPATVTVDAAQLEQVVINLIKNAAEAARSHRGEDARVRVSWHPEAGGDSVTVTVEDNGPGVANLENLFVPFFTTKPDGTGIGLVVSRQIVEAHGGELTVQNLPEGCRASVRLPASRVPDGDGRVEGGGAARGDEGRQHGDDDE